MVALSSLFYWSIQMKIQDSLAFGNIFIEECKNGYLVTYYPECKGTCKEFFSSWKDVNKFLQSIEE